MSVAGMLNSVELLVDLMRFPGQLMPFSTKAIFMSHISAAGESDSAGNDSCDSPLEPNSSLYGCSDRLDTGRLECKRSLYIGFFILKILKLLSYVCGYFVLFICHANFFFFHFIPNMVIQT